jgi:hypothetical protein
MKDLDSTQEVRAQNRAAPVTIVFNRDILWPQQPLQAITVHQGPDRSRRIRGVNPPELLFTNPLLNDFSVAAMAGLEENSENGFISFHPRAQGDEVKQNKVQFAVQLGAVKQDFQLGPQFGARRGLRSYHLIEGLIQLA